LASLSKLIEVAEELWPTSGAEEWDRPGIVSGDMDQEVTKVLLSVDVTNELLDDAIVGGFDLVLSHHPFLLRGITSVAEATSKGSVLAKAIRAGIALVSAHTNADITETGVSATLARKLGLSELSPLAETSKGIGHGRIGRLSKPLSLVEFSRAVAQCLPATAGGVKVAGKPGQIISRVAVCGGAGDSFGETALASGADVYITSDLRHHPTQELLESASAQGREFALIDISHWASESLWLEVAAKELENAIPGVKFEVSDLRTDPWDFALTQ
jgi:dinuclear metal center YbgI/SA1388 family protein